MTSFVLNSELVLAKIALFFVNAKDAMYRPFLTVYLISIGLNPAQSGVVSAVAMFSGAIGGISINILADKTRKHNLVMIVTNFMSIATMVSQPWLGAYVQQNAMSLRDLTAHQRIGTPYTNATTLWVSHIVSGSVVSVTWDDNQKENRKTNGNASDTWCSPYVTAIVAFSITRFFDGPNTGFCFTVVTATVRRQDSSATIGRQLVFGGIGTAVCAALAGVFIDHVQIPQISKFSDIFLLYPIAIIIYLSCCLILNRRKENRTDRQRHQDADLEDDRLPVFRSFRLALGSCRSLFFLATVLVSGIGLNSVYGYLSLYLKEMKASGTTMGLCTFASAASSVIGMEVAGKWIPVIGGPINTLCLACLSYCCRLAGFYFMTEAWQAPLIQILHFFGYGLFLPAMIQHIDAVSPANIKTSMQTIAVATHFQVSGLIADTAGGVLYKEYGGKTLYLIASSLMGFWTLTIILCTCARRPNQKHHGYSRQINDIAA